MWLLKCLNRTLSEHLWKFNMLKGAKHCLNLHGSSFVIFFDHSERTSVWKNSILVVSEFLRLFVNILTPSDEYSLSVKSEFFTQPIQNHLSLKLKRFAQFLSAYPQAASNLEHFEKRDEPHSWCTSEIIDCKMCDYWNA